MLRQHHTNYKGGEESDSTYLEFHSEQAYSEGWGRDWSQSFDFPIRSSGFTSREAASWTSAQIPARRSARSGTASGSKRLYLVVSDIDLAAREAALMDDDLEMLCWQRPTPIGGYVCHREQWL